jgi:hypothetical protein
MSEQGEFKIDEYGDNEVREYADTPIPKFLIGTYIILPIWGAIWWFMFWNGSCGFLDRGYWAELEKAAGTTHVIEEEQVPAKAVASHSS